MEFRILGTLEVHADDRELAIAGKQRALLALLLLEANRALPEDVLIEALWPEGPSPKAADNLHVLVSRLRRTLGRDRIVREGSGYLLRVEEGELDLDRFEQLRGEGKLTEALALWRGRPLVDFTYAGWAQNEIRRLEELRLVALEDRIEADLTAGLHTELVGELRALVDEHPLREELRRHLIVALYRSERQAEALEAYRDARRMLDEELGLEPSPALRELEGAVLRQDESLAAPQTLRPLGVSVGRRTRLALAAAAAAVLAFGAAGAAFALLERRGGEKTVAAASPRTGSATKPRAKARPKPKKTRLVVRPVRRASTKKTVPPAPPPAPQPPTVAPPPPRSAAPAPPPPGPPPPPAPPRRATKPKPKPKPKPQPPPAVQPLRISDNFDDGLFDRTIWHRSASTGVTIEERAGRLEVSVQPDAVAEGDYKLISASYGTQCRFLRDFDAQVEFELLEWPPANGAIVQLAAWFSDGNVGVVRQSQTWAEEYGSWMGTRNRSSPSVDTRGALRMRRTGRSITTYYRRGQGWYPLHTAWGYDGAPIIGLQVMSKDEWFADKPVRVAFDNFSLRAGEPAC